MNCTISGNNVSPGGTDGCFPSSNGGISVGGGISSSGTLLKNTIIAGNHENELNPGSPDVAGRVTSQGYNLIGNGNPDSAQKMKLKIIAPTVIAPM